MRDAHYAGQDVRGEQWRHGVPNGFVLLCARDGVAGYPFRYTRNMRTCEVEGCGRKHAAKGLCLMHYKRMRSRGTTDEFVHPPKPPCHHCEREAVARGLCPRHWKQWRLTGDPLHADKRREGPTYISRGYPIVRGRTGVPEHRIVAKAKPGEVVHHIDGDRANNSIENLAVLASAAEHRKAHSSLQRIAYQLIRLGVIGYDRESSTYYVVSER